MRNAGIWTAAVVSAALVMALGPVSDASAAPVTLAVATNGDDSAAGTLAHPLKTIQKAVDLAKPGDTIAVRGGTYALTDNITITTSGTASQPITLGAYPGEHVVVDGEQLPASHTPVGGSIPRAERGALHQEASYWGWAAAGGPGVAEPPVTLELQFINPPREARVRSRR